MVYYVWRILYSDSYVTIQFRLLACYCFARSAFDCLARSASGREALFRVLLTVYWLPLNLNVRLKWVAYYLNIYSHSLA